MPRLAADIGGTFTDIVLSAGERTYTAKVLTTHSAPAAGVLDGIGRVLRDSGVAPESIGTFIHGTTLAANAIIERRGARTALLVTRGHRDALETGYENRFDQYDIALSKPLPLVPRNLRWPVAERISAIGRVLLPLEERDIQELLPRIDAESIGSVAIGFINSYANAQHEERAAELLRAACPDLWITLSSEVSPQIREYDRLSTAVANAYVQPLMAGYLRDLQQRLIEAGLRCPLLLVMSTGGLTTLESAIRFPVRLVESGPAGGAILASELARRADFPHVIAFDMGGTTAKLCLIDHATPQLADSFEVDRVHRFVKGSGLPLRIPAVEMVEIGAGGGSIATIDELGRLRMGPRSAGSDPGPACFGRGGTQATVTDADLVLGKLQVEGFAGGLLELRVSLAAQAIATHVGEPLQTSTVQAAVAMCEIVDEAMANAARVHAVESGKEVANRTLIAFGGAAPLHAGRVAEKLGISTVVIPANAGVGSAVGFLLAPVSFEVTRTHITPLDQLTTPTVKDMIDSMTATATATVRLAAPHDELTVELEARMRYASQGHELKTPLSLAPTPDAPTFRAAFEKSYLAAYGRLISHVPITLVSLTLRVTAVGAAVAKPPAPPAQTNTTGANPAPPNTTPARPGAPPARPSTASAQPVATPAQRTYERAALAPGALITGPAIVTEPQTTTIIPTGMQATLNSWGDLVMTRKASP
jgi:N-methylhydantoinase A